MAKLYDFENNGTSGLKYTKGTGRATAAAEGFCFGYSLNWAAKMQKSGNPKLSRPDPVAAGPLQQKVEQQLNSPGFDWKSSVQKVCLDLGYSCGAPEQRVWDLLPAYVARVSGYHIVDIGNHWIAMGVGQNGWYFFDSNDGLHELADEASFANHAKAALLDYKNHPDLGTGFDMNHRAYKVVA
jgi:hypothetical protein